jgi:tetratricopeptide (TPR) repeat protein
VARGDLKGAIAGFQQAASLMPLSEYVIALGDALQADGQSEAAKRQYELVQLLGQLQQANGVDVDLEITLFEADHPNLLEPLPATLARARALVARRPTLYAADALAWTLYQSSDYAEAQSYSDQALRLNTQDALLWFHAGMIASQLGDTDRAGIDLGHALQINPNFSLLWAPVAHQTLKGLAAQ